ncbi:hypothetical protein MHYP_G00051140 [Metynnis hypsauchen]
MSPYAVQQTLRIPQESCRYFSSSALSVDYRDPQGRPERFLPTTPYQECELHYSSSRGLGSIDLSEGSLSANCSYNVFSVLIFCLGCSFRPLQMAAQGPVNTPLSSPPAALVEELAEVTHS